MKKTSDWPDEVEGYGEGRQDDHSPDAPQHFVLGAGDVDQPMDGGGLKELFEDIHLGLKD